MEWKQKKILTKLRRNFFFLIFYKKKKERKKESGHKTWDTKAALWDHINIHRLPTDIGGNDFVSLPSSTGNIVYGVFLSLHGWQHQSNQFDTHTHTHNKIDNRPRTHTGLKIFFFLVWSPNICGWLRSKFNENGGPSIKIRPKMRRESDEPLEGNGFLFYFFLKLRHDK